MRNTYETSPIGECQNMFASIAQESAAAAGRFSRPSQSSATSPLCNDGNLSNHDRVETAAKTSQAVSLAGRLSRMLHRAHLFQPLRRDPTYSLIGELGLSSDVARTRSRRFSECSASFIEEHIRLVQRVFLTGAQTPKVVVFTGIVGGNGCTSVCAESALALVAQSSKTVCLVDGDLRCPSVHRYFGMSNERGIAQAMTESGPITDYGRQFVDGKLWIMTSGVCHTGGQLLASEAMRARLKDLRDTFDFVLIDAPPITSFVDAIQLGCLADGVVLVVGANSTRREAAVRAKQYLNAANCRVLAAVLNRRTFPIPASIFRWLK